MGFFQPQSLNLPDGVWVYWGPMNGGDLGGVIQMYAFPSLLWQLTGYAVNNDPDHQPNVPVMPDRQVLIQGSLDPTPPRCYCKIAIISANQQGDNGEGMNSRQNDPFFDGSLARFRWVRVLCLGTPNPAGPDCGVQLFGALNGAPDA